ncbi:hypothetical protein PLIP_a0011 [Pseudoalteromonas lipolytica LMEB 39]|nr:hypothetical protein [Pseudoalteromonas lipolytica LMEB 39]
MWIYFAQTTNHKPQTTNHKPQTTIDGLILTSVIHMLLSYL